LSNLRLLKGPEQLEPSTLAGKPASSWTILNSANNSQTLTEKEVGVLQGWVSWEILIAKDRILED